VTTLTPYEHLRRLFRLCRIHGFRNIKSSTVPEDVKVKMRNLFCITHTDWDATVSEIEEKGGKAGKGK
jgi:hypothetical protein